MYFLDLSYADFYPGAATTVNGRVHVNGDFCMDTENAGVTIAKVTASGRIMHGTDTRCTYLDYSGLATGANIATGTNLTNVVPIGKTNDNGCTNCKPPGGAASNLNWLTYALQTWGGNVQDTTMGVNALSLPLPQVATTQIGANGGNPHIGQSNANNMRFLIDPVQTTDTKVMLQMKYASQADVRIIDGVWYLKNPMAPNSWPGYPIWSDHPGHFVDSFGTPVGQGDLRTALQPMWGIVPWNPKGFSYYEYDETAQSISSDDDTHGVISYGSLYRGADPDGTSHWTPGHYLNNFMGTGAHFRPCDNLCCNLSNTAANVYNGDCQFGRMGPTGWGYDTIHLNDPLNCTPTITYNALTPMNCTLLPEFSSPASGNLGISTNLLNATRSGFHDYHMGYYDCTWSGIAPCFLLSQMLPMNVDLGQFQLAMQNTTAGELGSYFGSGGFVGHPFNGIVYVSLNWPGIDGTFANGSLQGFNPPDSPEIWPLVNAGSGDETMPQTHSKGMQGQTLPYELCSSDKGMQPYDKKFGWQRWYIPPCSSYLQPLNCFASSSPSASCRPYANSVRFINAAKIDPTVFPHGLSLVSNVPVYVTGSVNTLSNVTSQTATPWIPVMIAGDQVLFLSNAWDDYNSNWSLGPSNASLPRPATSTTYNMEYITGWERDSVSEGLHSAPSLMEDWTGSTLTFNGSIVAGFYPVYDRGGRYYESGVIYRAGTRNISYDPHLNLSNNQPPGTPSFSISDVEKWTYW
jgi:hypothetical protein